MERAAPKILIAVVVVIAISLASNFPIEATLVIAVCFISFMVDVLLFHFERNRKALQWIVNNVHLTDKPIEGSDAPESIKKLIRRGGDNKSDKE